MSLLARYEEAAKLTHQMLAAAQVQDWDSMNATAEMREKIFAGLPQKLPPLPNNEQLALARLIRDILDCHTEIAEHAKPWLEHTATLLAKFKQA